MTSRGDSTRANLLDTAELLWGTRGVRAVSLREIRLAAGARNSAAIQFHFGDRDGLIDALIERHMPRIAAIQQRIYEQMVEEGREDDERSLVEVLVRPSAEYMARGPSERSWIKIISDLLSDPDLELSQLVQVAPAPAMQATRTIHRKLTELMKPAVANSRLVVLAQGIVHVCADRARRVDNAPVTTTYVDAETFVDVLVDMMHGALFAPATVGVRSS
jgi:AcrR family transcriptional regulator